MTTDGVVPWNYSIHVFAPRAGCGEAYPTTNTGRRDPPLLGGETNRPDSVELHGGNVPSQKTEVCGGRHGLFEDFQFRLGVPRQSQTFKQKTAHVHISMC